MYKKLVLGTANVNKVDRIRKLLKDSSLEVVTLNDISSAIPEPEETALTCTSIAAQKALHYLDYVDDDSIVLTQDDTIVFEGVSEEDNPGVHIKKPVVDIYGEFTDENAIKYYTSLAKKYGGSIPMTFQYGHAIAYRRGDDRKTIDIIASNSKLEVRLVDYAVNQEKVPGYFLAAIMQMRLDGEWHNYTELSDQQLIEGDADIKASITSLFEKANISL